ncbi:hypothetical protein K491DRAFT_682444 [Lophiostoma macrostomum CBS 122681]|uniref:Uncharacterized protein n=1 Tax=Lophiostoma macrostomum CBS 122681 TaxID=1314788 RepID=A0A6A6SU05_9PLEO|nr:hypothetical protein K491DRAFT_682444 [Lophiostoma macrostomum CBS 122681]
MLSLTNNSLSNPSITESREKHTQNMEQSHLSRSVRSHSEDSATLSKKRKRSYTSWEEGRATRGQYAHVDGSDAQYTNFSATKRRMHRVPRGIETEEICSRVEGMNNAKAEVKSPETPAPIRNIEGMGLSNVAENVLSRAAAENLKEVKDMREEIQDVRYEECHEQILPQTISKGANISSSDVENIVATSAAKASQSVSLEAPAFPTDREGDQDLRNVSPQGFHEGDEELVMPAMTSESEEVAQICENEYCNFTTGPATLISVSQDTQPCSAILVSKEMIELVHARLSAEREIEYFQHILDSRLKEKQNIFMAQLTETTMQLHQARSRALEGDDDLSKDMGRQMAILERKYNTLLEKLRKWQVHKTNAEERRADAQTRFARTESKLAEILSMVLPQRRPALAPSFEINPNDLDAEEFSAAENPPEDDSAIRPTQGNPITEHHENAEYEQAKSLRKETGEKLEEAYKALKLHQRTYREQFKAWEERQVNRGSIDLREVFSGVYIRQGQKCTQDVQVAEDRHKEASRKLRSAGGTWSSQSSGFGNRPWPYDGFYTDQERRMEESIETVERWCPDLSGNLLDPHIFVETPPAGECEILHEEEYEIHHEEEHDEARPLGKDSRSKERGMHDTGRALHLNSQRTPKIHSESFIRDETKSYDQPIPLWDVLEDKASTNRTTFSNGNMIQKWCRAVRNGYN